jgi:RsiW-degrading membrane proteinase PrsW (M82 family)
MENRPGGPYQQRESDTPTKSQLLPFLSEGREVINKAHFIPFVVLFLLSFWVPNPFLWIVALALAMGTYYLVYRLCGKHIQPWMPLIPAAMTAALMLPGPWQIFEGLFGIFIGGQEQLPAPQFWAQIPFPTLFYKIFFFVGLKEEFVKALPVVILAFVAPKITAKFGRALEIREPLDGILVATGSALGFTLYETMMDYIPRQIQQGGFGAGIDLLLQRVGGDLAGHIAYSGYLGYFIGLAMMRPKGRAKTIAIGWLFASVMHTFWDALDGMPELLVGIISYGLLGAAILKARQISPMRAQNFATQLYRGDQPLPVQPAVSPQNASWSQVTTAPPPVAAIPAPPIPIPAHATKSGALTFHVGGKKFPLTAGRRFSETDIPVLTAAGADGIVGEVTTHPSDPSILGLRNLSIGSWIAMTPTGESREIPAGKTIRLSPGTTVQFGKIHGEVTG